MYVVHPSYVVDLRSISVKRLVKALIEARGAQSAAHVRTRLNRVLEMHTGLRGKSNGRDRMNGTAAVIHG